MSITSWKKEYYPITAKKAAKQGVSVALRHSLVKWRGLREENLQKHCVEKWGEFLWFNGKKFRISDKTCALCSLFDRSACPNCPDCPDCPLRKGKRKGWRCDKYSNYLGNPYTDWAHKKDPEPMINLIVNAIRREQRRERIRK